MPTPTPPVPGPVIVGPDSPVLVQPTPNDPPLFTVPDMPIDQPPASTTPIEEPSFTTVHSVADAALLTEDRLTRLF